MPRLFSLKPSVMFSNKTYAIYCLGVATLGCLLTSGQVNADLLNSGFEDPVVADGAGRFTSASNVPGWATTSTEIEFWRGTVTDPDPASGLVFEPYKGDQWVELNAREPSALYQEVDASAAGIANGDRLHFGFAHRGRAGLDTMKLTITDLGVNGIFGDADDTALFQKEYSADNTAWVLNTDDSESAIFALGNNMRFSYEAVSTGGNNVLSVGNFIDEPRFGIEKYPEPSSGIMAIVAAMSLMVCRRRR